MYQRLQSMGLDAQGFSNTLRRSGCLVAGSFPLQVYLNKTWDESDIDIWANEKSVNEMTIHLLKEGYPVPKRLSLQVDHTDCAKSYARLQKYVRRIFAFTCRGKPNIQIIVIRGESIKDVIDTFDLTVCQVFYDGENITWLHVHSKDDADNMKLVITQRAIEEQSLFEWIRTYIRIAKYMNRGFHKPDWNVIVILHQRTRRHVEFCILWNRWSYRLKLVYPEVSETFPIFVQDERKNILFVEGMRFIGVFRPKEGQKLTENELITQVEDEDEQKFPFEVAPSVCLDLSTASDTSRQDLLRANSSYVSFLYKTSAFCMDSGVIQNVLDNTGTRVVYMGYIDDLSEEVDVPVPYTARLELLSSWTYEKNEIAIRELPKLKRILMKVSSMDDLNPSDDAYVRDLLNRLGIRPEKGNETVYGWLSRTISYVNSKNDRKEIPERDNSIFYNCDRSDKTLYYMLRLSGRFLVKFSDILKTLKRVRNGHQVFRIEPVLDSNGNQVRFERTQNHAMKYNRGSAVSADHCQEGSDRKLYTLVPVVENLADVDSADAADAVVPVARRTQR